MAFALHRAVAMSYDYPAQDPVALPTERLDAAPDLAAERRVNRVDDASALDESAAIDPRELDAMVRIEEGATVDDEAPVAGVRYEGEETTPHRYGQPDDAYGPGHGDGRIGFDKVVGDAGSDTVD